MLNPLATNPTALPLFFRTYSRRKPDRTRENWTEMVDRTTEGLIKLGKLTIEEVNLIRSQQLKMTALTSGRWQWVGGTAWIEDPKNFSGAYNCSAFELTDWETFGFLMNLTMQGCGTGSLLERRCISKLPPICNKLNIVVNNNPGDYAEQFEDTHMLEHWSGTIKIEVGDSRQAWTAAYLAILNLASDPSKSREMKVEIDLGGIRANGSQIEGFGGLTNSIGLRRLFDRMGAILNGALGQQLNSVECCLLLDEASLVVVAGNIRRSASIHQFDSTDALAAVAKDNLWQEVDGKWAIDPDRNALRMGNHTRVFHHKPSREECQQAVSKQYYSGEGAIQWAGEAVMRSNVDLLNDRHKQVHFLHLYNFDRGMAKDYLAQLMGIKAIVPVGDAAIELNHRIDRYLLNPCGEIISKDFMCNLSDVHLNLLDPTDTVGQEQAFKAASISAAALLNHKFTNQRQQTSRELDPIIGVSITGLFDFFVNAFGMDWLRWWQAGRPEKWNEASPNTIERINSFIPGSISRLNSDDALFKAGERYFLSTWRSIVEATVQEYCTRNNLKVPNRCTTVQPSGSKSLLTGASPGWHPPKAQRFIRRMTFQKNDPVALACIDYGYSVIPSQSDKDEHGNLLEDPFCEACTEWLIEMPVEVSWANLSGVEKIKISKFSALAQMDFYLQVQNYYTTHNTSATIEFREEEIEPLTERIYQAILNDEGYISTALLARFDDRQTYPRMPFEPIDRATFNRLNTEVLMRRKTDNFEAALAKYDTGKDYAIGPAGCDSGKCMMPEIKR